MSQNIVTDISGGTPRLAANEAHPDRNEGTAFQSRLGR